MVLLETLTTSTSAQMSADHMHIEAPKWISPRVVISLFIVSLSVPCYIVGMVLLVRRRKMFPIAGRGFCALLIFCINPLVCVPLVTAAMIIYPHGLPCALHTALLWGFMPEATAMMVRGWILVFRIEIMNYLAEMAWRQSKRDQLLKRGEIARNRLSADILSMPSLEPESIQGHFFITHRYWMKSKFIALGVATMSLATITMITIVGIFDPDIALTDTWRSKQGLHEDHMSSQYVNGAFWDAPRCLIYSIKVISQHCVHLFFFFC